MIVKLLTEHHLEFLSLKEAGEAHLSLHLSKCSIVGNLTHWLKIILYICIKLLCMTMLKTVCSRLQISLFHINTADQFLFSKNYLVLT